MKILGVTSRACVHGASRTVAITASLLVGATTHSLPGGSNSTALQRHHLPIQIHRRRDQTVSESYNWSGYAVTAATGSVTDVKSSWIVPTVASTCAGVPEGYAAFWTGIDGWSSNTVEQIGTDSDCVNLAGTRTGTPTYYAWFEFYPQDAYLIGEYSSSGACKSDCVEPGDIISAEVKFSGTAATGFRHRGALLFTVTISDQTQGWSFTTSSTVPGAKQSSAEWIAETPYGCNTSSGFCNLSDFGTVDYGDYLTSVLNTSYATVAGVTQAIGSFGSSVQEAVMVSYSGDATMAQPSSLEGGSGTSFSDVWDGQGP
jgi:hypothetical protein